MCANRGSCDSLTGVCNCYNTNGDAYGSSDGYGSAGPRGDCGYVRGVVVLADYLFIFFYLKFDKSSICHEEYEINDF